MTTLDNRLNAAADFCREGKIAADVGCDHAQLACFLAQSKSRLVIASDLRDGPLLSAKKTVEKQGVSNVKVLKSDGLQNIDFADDVIICGMGGELIAEIIGGCRFLNDDTRFILQPMTKPERLRRWLYNEGFEIIEERAAVDCGKYYSIMLVRYIGEKREIDDIFALTGKVTDSGYLRHIAGKLLKNADGMSESESFRESAESLRRQAAEILKSCEEML